MANVPSTRDLIQELDGHSIDEMPEIRVWIHPERKGEAGSDAYVVFPSFAEAIQYIAAHKVEAEGVPLVAFRGYELNLFDMAPIGPRSAQP